MITIAILAAMRSELQPLLALGMGGEITEVLVNGPVYIQQARYLNAMEEPIDVRYLLMVCGIGKVRAAAATQALIDHYHPHLVLNVGTAGALRPEIAIGDIVITLAQHQHDSQLWERFVAHADTELSQFIHAELSRQRQYRVHLGNGCAGDVFQDKREAKGRLAEQFGAYCVDMESAAIADICALNRIPFCIVRSISDSLDGAADEFEANYQLVSRQVAEGLRPLMSSLALRLADQMGKQSPATGRDAGYRFSGLDTPRLRLRRFRANDAAHLQRYRAHPEVALYQGWDADYSLTQAQSLVREMVAFDLGYPGTWFQMAIELKETGSLIGDIGVHTVAGDPGQVKIGYTLAREYQGRGLATEALAALLDYLSTVMKRHRVTAYVDIENERSIKLLERLGFRREGHLRENSWSKGEWRDDYEYAILRDEWRS